MYICDLHIEDFCCIRDTKFSLNYPGRPFGREIQSSGYFDNINLLLGGNGSGKTSVLRAICVAALAPVLQNSGFNASFLVRRASSTVSIPISIAQVYATLVHSEFVTSDSPATESVAFIRRERDVEFVSPRGTGDPVLQSELFSNTSAEFFLVAYGSSRRSERVEAYNESIRSVRYGRVASLFEEHVGLLPFNTGAILLEQLGRMEEARTILNGLLCEPVTLTEDARLPSPALFNVNQNGVALPFNALSDGYRAFVAWVWDLLVQLARLEPVDGEQCALTEIPGVVIVDEIDLLLHPEWQRTAIRDIAQAFPRLQFLFSSHSPLVAGTLDSRNIYMLDTDSEGWASVDQYNENIYGLTANQVLTSSYFGLDSTRAPGAGTLSDDAARALGFIDYSTLLANATRDPITGVIDVDPEALAKQMLEEIAVE